MSFTFHFVLLGINKKLFNVRLISIEIQIVLEDQRWESPIPAVGDENSNTQPHSNHHLNTHTHTETLSVHTTEMCI